MDNKNLEIGVRIKKARKEKGLTLRKLGDLIGRTESLMARYEKGQVEIPLSGIEKLAEALNTTADSLLYGETTTRIVNYYDEKTGESGTATMVVFPEGHPLHVPKYEAEITNAEAKVTFETKIETALEAITQDYQLLNSTGRGEAAKRVHELTLIDEYTKEG